MTDVEPRLHIGWHALHPDPSLDFQLNRWAAYGGPRWVDDVRPILPRLVSYDAWRDLFCELGDRAAADGRLLHAALHLRAAEFFMLERDPRKAPTRSRLVALYRQVFPLEGAARREVSLDGARLPVLHLGIGGPRGVLVVFGGFDSYLEELLPLLVELADRGFEVVAFEGPGQGAVLEEQGVPMTPDWHRPVGAVLDSLGLDDVTMIGISLGGCLAVRAAAEERRVRRVVAFDVLSDFSACLLRQIPALARPVARALLAPGAGFLLDVLVRVASARRPVIEWGAAQAMRVLGRAAPHQAWRAARAFRTDDVSPRVTQDVLLLSGAEDHYVPSAQLDQQLRSLHGARSVTARVFTRAEHAHAHCQVGNLPLALDVIELWLESLRRRDEVIGT